VILLTVELERERHRVFCGFHDFPTAEKAVSAPPPTMTRHLGVAQNFDFVAAGNRMCVFNKSARTVLPGTLDCHTSSR